MVPSVNPNVGFGAGGALDAAGQIQGEVAKPDLTVPRQPLRRATGAVQSTAGTARDAVGSTIRDGGG
jgi:hypothetical protein